MKALDVCERTRLCVCARRTALASSALLLLVPACAPLPKGASRASVSPTAQSSTPSPVRDALTEAGRTFIQSKKGTQWMMEASKVKWKNAGKQGHLDTVDWTLQSPHGKGTITVKAPGAEVFVDTSRVQFEGMVDTIRLATGDHLRGRDFLWDGKKGLLIGNNGVRWARGSTVVTADRVTASDHLEHIHLRGNVKITTLMTKGKEKGIGL